MKTLIDKLREKGIRYKSIPLPKIEISKEVKDFIKKYKDMIKRGRTYTGRLTIRDTSRNDT